MDSKLEVVKLLSKAAGLKESEVSEILEVPPNPKLGDFAMPCFRLAAKLKSEPKKIAYELSKKVNAGGIVREAKPSGPYLNIFLDNPKLAEQVIGGILKQKDRFGSLAIGKGQQVVFDIIGLNPNKAGHIGHVRNGCIGSSLAKIYEFAGFGANTQSFINDQGLPTAMTFYAYKYLKERLPKREGLMQKEDHWQGAVYELMRNLVKNDEAIKKEVEKLQHELEHGNDKKILKEQREFIERCKAAQAETWNRLNADFDLGVHESDLTRSGILEKTYDLLIKKGAVYRSVEGDTKGCLMLKLSQFDYFKGMLTADKILVRSDGRATYTGKDVGLQFWRFGLIPDLLKYQVSSKSKTHTEWGTNNLAGKKIRHGFNKNTKCIHIVGAEQRYVIAADYYAMKAAGYEKEFQNSYHLASGLVGFGEDTKISSREGAEGLSADEILDKAKGLALAEIMKRNPDMYAKEAGLLAEKISISAVRYYLLRTDPTKFVKFSFEDALSFEGNTGPYLQYALVRANKILKKAGKPKSAGHGLLAKPEEFALVKALGRFQDAIAKAVAEYNPSAVANYAFELANTFSTFYEACPVIAAESEGLRNVRLKLVQAFAQVLKNALFLLGIEEVEVM